MRPRADSCSASKDARRPASCCPSLRSSARARSASCRALRSVAIRSPRAWRRPSSASSWIFSSARVLSRRARSSLLPSTAGATSSLSRRSWSRARVRSSCVARAASTSARRVGSAASRVKRSHPCSQVLRAASASARRASAARCASWAVTCAGPSSARAVSSSSMRRLSASRFRAVSSLRAWALARSPASCRPRSSFARSDSSRRAISAPRL